MRQLLAPMLYDDTDKEVAEATARQCRRQSRERRLCFRSAPCSSQGQALTPEHAEG